MKIKVNYCYFSINSNISLNHNTNIFLFLNEMSIFSRWETFLRIILTILTCHRWRLDSHCNQLFLQFYQVCHKGRKRTSLVSPDFGSKGSSSHPNFIFKGFFILNLIPKTNLCSNNSLRINPLRPKSKPRIDLPPRFKSPISIIRPDINSAHIQVQIIHRWKDQFRFWYLSDLK